MFKELGSVQYFGSESGTALKMELEYTNNILIIHNIKTSNRIVSFSS
jgi:hypothetical protein